MCGVFGQTKLNFDQSTSPEVIASALLTSPIANQTIAANANIWTGMLAAVVVSQDKERDFYQPAYFGYTPFWAKKKFHLFNARAEGKENEDNDPNYRGQPGIFKMPAFRHAIKNKRCLIPVDYFIEGTVENRLSEPFLVRRQDKNAFYLGGIWDDWVNKQTGEYIRSFAIITTAATPLLQKIPHHRSPLIIAPNQVNEWLHYQTDWYTIKDYLRPSNMNAFEAYPISPKVKTKENDEGIFEPLGEVIRV